MNQRVRPPARTAAGHHVPPPPAVVSAPARAVYRVLRVAAAAVCGLWFRLRVQGRERVPVAGPFILAPVHRSNLDFLLAGVACPRVPRFMAKDSIWRAPRFARFVTWMGAFPVRRDRVDRAALRWTAMALHRGDPVVMFPEGGRRTGPTVLPLQSGVAWTAARARVPIVPVAIGGSDRAMPIGSLLVRPCSIRILIGEPIYPEVPLSGRVARSEVDALTERLRAEMQRMYDEVR